MTLDAIDPTTGELIASHEEHDDNEVGRRVKAAAAAQREWARRSFAERAVPVRRAAELLEGRAREYGTLMAREMGKPLADGEGEAKKCAAGCRYYAEHAAAFLGDEEVPTEARKSFVAYQPLGVLLAVMPWNFPFWQVFRAAAPALMAGNAVALKHAANVPGCAMAIEQLWADAGLPAGLFTNLLITSSRVAAVIEMREIAAVTLTGSVGAGKAVAAKAGSLVKKTVLELGGSDAYVVLDDADLDQAVEVCTKSRLINSGQSCIAAKRFVVVEPLREAFERGMVERMRAARMGNPLEPGIEVGPQARVDLRDSLHEQVEKSVAAGARLLLGGEVPPGPGAFYPPTVLADVRPGMPAYDEELFGPVAAILPAKDEADAVRIANDSVFGLGGAVFTRDVARGERVARELAAGCCFVNDFVRSDPRLPFGGVKESGYGRELGSVGMREFVNVKTVWVGGAK
ncbi:MAG TPA: NAD-dependent succinate-semialdehyde dehydrogenase [Thermoanaerobaculia bacterium]|jgi:succinate-semialdehyde dehydrogenase/glutarate-semialdehyde dehydrogenase|nr:NAD-dependent succinate-semialdehyde dehydrogenase [Thermoanaerobaculia bacterium]